MVCLKRLREKKSIFLSGYMISLLTACQTVVKSNPSTQVDNAATTSSYNGYTSYVQSRVNAILQTTAPSVSEEQAADAFLIGKELEGNGNFESAEKLLELSFYSYPTFITGMDLIKIKIAQKKIEEAKKIAIYLIGLYPKKSEISIILANIYQIENNYKDYLDVLKNSHKNQPNNENITLLYAGSLKSDSKNILLKFIEKNPNSARILINLAQLYFVEKDYKKAFKYASRAYIIDTDNDEIITMLGNIKQEEKNYSEAEKYFRLSFEKTFSNPSLENYLNVLILQKKLKKTLETLLKVEASSDEAQPFPPELSLQTAKLFLINKNYNEAKNRLIKLLFSNYAPNEVKYYLAVCSQKEKEFLTALNYLNDIPKENEFFKDAEKQKIVTLINSGEKEKAKAELDNFEIQEKNSIDEIYFKASLLAYFKKHDEALIFLEKHIKENPEAKELYLKKAQILEGRNNPDSTQKSLLFAEKIITKWPKYTDALNYLGYLLVHHNKELNKAKVIIKRAIQLEPQNGFFLDSLGWLYYQKKDFKNALKYLTEAKQYEPTEAVISYHLAMAQLGNQQLKESLVNLENTRKFLSDMLPFDVNSDFELINLSQNIDTQISRIRSLF